MRKTVFANEEYYHIYNRGVDKREVFLDEQDYVRFLKNLREFNSDTLREERIRIIQAVKSEFDSAAESNSDKPLVEIVAYCLNPNHYHLILKQNSEKGVEKFMQKVGTGYTNYFNIKQKRSGALFQGKFKAIHINSNEYLLYLSAYVNRNFFIHGYEKTEFDSGTVSNSGGFEWQYCSAPDYLGKRKGTLCDKSIVLNQFAGKSEFDSREIEYGKFLKDNSEYFKNKKELEKYCLE